MSLAASSSFSSMASMASTSSAAATPISAWASAAANKNWVGSAWILSSAILTTYSTTKFLKYQGDQETLPPSDRGSKAFRQFGSILNSTQKRDDEPQIEVPKKSVRRTKLSRASLLTLYRFSGSLLLGLIIHSHFYDLSRLLPRFLQTVQVAQMFLLPSLFLFIANYSNSIALDRIGISLTYTSKCGIPLITVLFTLLLDGISALPSNATLFSLLPIAIGIGAASWNSPTFELFGFVAALVSTMSQAALNVVSKRVMRKTGVKGVEAQRAMVFVALGIGLIMTWANALPGKLKELREYGSNIRNVATADEEQAPSISFAHPPPWLTFLAVLAYHMEYVLSFSFVGLVEPITYGTCDALRRLLIIVTGRKLFGGDKFSKTNLGGIFMALLGALMYSITSAKNVGLGKIR
ncbi:hypothetical protein ACHAXR_011315 [Thalassiosira sp. AJA248-18]